MLKGWLRSRHLLRGHGADREAAGLVGSPAPGSAPWSQAGRRLGAGAHWVYLCILRILAWEGVGISGQASSFERDRSQLWALATHSALPSERSPDFILRAAWLLCQGLPCFGALSHLGVLLCPAPKAPRPPPPQPGCLHLDPSRAVLCTAPQDGGGPSPTPQPPARPPQCGPGSGTEGGGPHGARKPERDFAQRLRVCVCPRVTMWGEQGCPLSGWPWGRALCAAASEPPAPTPRRSRYW